MNIVKNKEKYTADLSGSMTDICFLLIIFFLVAAVFINEEGLALLLPSQNSEPQKKLEDKIIQMKIRPDMQIEVDSVLVGISELVATMRAKPSMREDSLSAMVNPPTVLLEIDEGISYEYAMKVLSIVERTGVKDFTVSSTGSDTFLIPINFSSIKGYMRPKKKTE